MQFFSICTVCGDVVYVVVALRGWAGGLRCTVQVKNPDKAVLVSWPELGVVFSNTYKYQSFWKHLESLTALFRYYCTYIARKKAKVEAIEQVWIHNHNASASYTVVGEAYNCL